jgi:hypothetical protein
LPNDPTDVHDEQLSEIYNWAAYALWELEKNEGEAFVLAKKAFHFNRANEKALKLLREIKNIYSEKTRTYKLLTVGHYPRTFIGDSTLLSFYTSYIVVADSPEEGLKLIKDIEANEIGEELKIDESEVLEHRPDLPKGVYKTLGLIFYDRE